MKHPNKFLAILLVILLAAGLFSIPANAASTVDQTIKVELDNKPISFDVPPTIEKGRTLVPLRAIFEALGALVKWEPETKTVTAVKGNTTVKLSIGSKTAYKNNEKIALDVPAKIINGRTLVPLRFISESLGYKVKWDATSRLVSISSGGIIKKIAEKIAGVVEKIVKPKPTEEVAEKPAEEPKETTSKEKPRAGGGGGGGGGRGKSSPSEVARTLTIVDSAGRKINVPQPLEKVVVLASQPAEVIAALGCQDKVIGVTEDHVLRDRLTKLIYKGKPSVGGILTPSVERIIELNPQLVISIGGWGQAKGVATSLGDQLKDFGIPVACIDCFPDTEAIFRDVTILGRLFNKEQKAKEYIEFFQKQLDIVKEKTANLESSKKVKVYMEAVDYVVTDWIHKMIEAAGGINIVANVSCPSAKVSPELVIEKNPQIIIVRAMPPLLLGYEAKPEQAKKKWEDIMSRPGWSEVEAVKNKKVYLIAFEICSAPRAPVGILYMAKWFYPEMFQDVEPALVHQEFLSRFFGLKEYPGTFVYPES